MQNNDIYLILDVAIFNKQQIRVMKGNQCIKIIKCKPGTIYEKAGELLNKAIRAGEWRTELKGENV